MSKSTVAQQIPRIALAVFALTAALSTGTAQADPLTLDQPDPAASIASTDSAGSGSGTGSVATPGAILARMACDLSGGYNPPYIEEAGCDYSGRYGQSTGSAMNTTRALGELPHSLFCSLSAGVSEADCMPPLLGD
ncbi:MAG: hypothetical protein JWN03_3951 [Nocardia sp.]|uniref:hypothetical protein n=1 Tax=Nocardia sp. TaxID=1821 RepID=UPI00260C9B28|nr:hypothetical protein [Nocardia sp.]MCU1643676.1 hypothetical protein [Nocardia sp.]